MSLKPLFKVPANAVFLTGPTAVGKSELALCLAEHLDGEIISVDSMQVYRGLDIGTAKPSKDERLRVRHHLIDVCDLTERFSAAQFIELAGSAVADIQARKRVAIFCGGTGLYFKALFEGLGTAPPSDPGLRDQLQSQPLETLLDELKEADPVTFASIDRKNPRRVVRAVEVLRLTGKPFSVQRARWTEATESPQACPRLYALCRPQLELQTRIEQRVDWMFAHGLVDETRALLARGLEGNPVALQAVGYRQVVEHLRGERSIAATVDLVKARTRQFAKRQSTWFKHQLPVTWLQVTGGAFLESALERILKAQRAS